MTSVYALARELSEKLGALKGYTEAKRTVHRALKDGIMEAEGLSTKLCSLLAQKRVAPAMQEPKIASSTKASSREKGTPSAAAERHPRAPTAASSRKACGAAKNSGRLSGNTEPGPSRDQEQRASAKRPQDLPAGPVPAPRKHSSLPTPKPRQQQQPREQQKRPQKRVRREDLIIVEASKEQGASAGITYAQMLRRITELHKEEKASPVKKIRVSGGVIKMAASDTNALLNIATRATANTGYRARLVMRTTKVTIRDLDAGATKEDVTDALRDAADFSEDKGGKIDPLRPSYGGTQTVTVTLPIAPKVAAILREGRIVVGMVRCRIAERVEVQRCFRCLGFGHRAGHCKGEDRSTGCHNCHEAGHRAVNCKKAAHCSLCKDGDHKSGSSSCQAFKEALRKAQGWRT